MLFSRNKPTPPPPLPPHATPPHLSERQKPQQQDGTNQEYRPPVPPHRNIGVNARMGMTDSPSPRKHHHHHHRNSRHQESSKHQQDTKNVHESKVYERNKPHDDCKLHEKQSNLEDRGILEQSTSFEESKYNVDAKNRDFGSSGHLQYVTCEPKMSIFEFDDEPLNNVSVESPVQIRHKEAVVENDDNMQFVLPSNSDSVNGNGKYDLFFRKFLFVVHFF